ncbi:elongation factor P 5-aminopentanone reductase [Sinanaerobacter sp. ZZT-01]|uniref:elongation factor P 5-aminopentanone reductase n=1 Tax=Sinanaerobacter sp. ZZT-01 TaxID=3111540 RepID=UPI002D76AAF5|nr:SDR family oxidoreductase [Sinanaerobacter sp. ZZT-01]WRR94640.1 SDR family oxidoreductase [Sinanaerobacter sp. ZZT-01]
MGDYKNTIIITGASRGIGKACAEIFAEEGWQVVIGYHKSEVEAKRLEASLLEKGFSVQAIQADVTKQEEVKQMFSKARATFGKVDALVNNAGISQFRLFTDMTEQEWDQMFDIHCKGAFFCTQCALEDMISSKSGSIVNVSSMWGQVGASCEVHYSASKAALIGLTKALAKELGPSNIRVNCIAPGVIETDMMKSVSGEIKQVLCEETPLMRMGSAQEIAKAILFLSSEKASFITGQVLGVNGGFVIG